LTILTGCHADSWKGDLLFLGLAFECRASVEEVCLASSPWWIWTANKNHKLTHATHRT